MMTYRFVAHRGELLIGIAQIAIGVAHKVRRVPGDRVGDDLLFLDGTRHVGNLTSGMGSPRNQPAESSTRQRREVSQARASNTRLTRSEVFPRMGSRKKAIPALMINRDVA